MPDNNPEILKIFRLLSPKRRADLVAQVYLAYTAESSVRKSLGLTVQNLGSSLKPQKYFCGNSLKRRKK